MLLRRSIRKINDAFAGKLLTHEAQSQESTVAPGGVVSFAEKPALVLGIKVSL
jgi:hypothetical protein